MRKNFLAAAVIFLIMGVLALTGCNGENGASAMERPIPIPLPNVVQGRPPAAAEWPMPEDIVARPPVTLQLTPLVKGEELVVLHTNYGDITLRLFPQAAPLAVQNFFTHARDGYYDGLTFHRVMNNFMIQGGCPQGTGRGGETIWGTGIGPEHNYDLWHFRGALAMAQSDMPNSIGSQFYIVQNPALHASYRQEFEAILADYMDEVVWPENWDGRGDHLTLGDIYLRDMLEHYLQVGGTPFLDFPFNDRPPNYGHTVFGHVVSGMEVVDAIAAVPTNPDTHPTAPNRPLEDVIIERVSIIEYQG